MNSIFSSKRKIIKYILLLLVIEEIVKTKVSNKKKENTIKTNYYLDNIDLYNYSMYI